MFPLYSPRLAKITVVRRGRVRRAKLYYLRGRTGKSARIAEKKTTPPKKAAAEAAPVGLSRLTLWRFNQKTRLRIGAGFFYVRSLRSGAAGRSCEDGLTE